MKKALRKYSKILQRRNDNSITEFYIVLKKPLKFGQKFYYFYCYLFKQKKVYTKLQNEKHVLYNYVSNILLDRIYTKKLIPLKNSISLIASRGETNKFLNYNFKNYIQKQVDGNHKVKLNIEIKPPYEEKCLQAVDFICWAVYRKIGCNDESY